MKELFTMLMPIFVCILTGFIGYLQYKFKYSYELRIKKDAEREKNLIDSITNLKIDIDLLKNDYNMLKKTLREVKQSLYTNNEVTKRLEIGFMIMQHPNQVLSIQRLIEEYKGNHYVYDIVKTWAEEQDVDLNPRLLERMEYQQSIAINAQSRSEDEMI